MTGAPQPFQFGGRLSLDLTWTLRYRAVDPTELLLTPADLRAWITAAVAPLRATPTVDDLAAAVELREAVYRAALAASSGRTVRTTDRRTINGWAARPAAFRSLDAGGGSRLALRADDPCGSALAAVAADAVDVLALADGRLRQCEGPGCSLLFHDSSRPGRRRWCSTERCGNRVNTRTYRRRTTGGTNHQ
jgi:predicted RNA-binding Zn ribbon-like protein